MRKIYLFMLTLICAMGVTSANAEKTSLYLDAANAVRKNPGTSSTNWGLASDVPTAEKVAYVFGDDTNMSASGMIWGLGNGDSAFGTDFQNGASTSFTFVGRQNYSGEYVAQMYILNKDVNMLNLSYTFSGYESNNSFSIWKVSEGTATKLASRSFSDAWTSGQKYSFFLHEKETPLLSSGDRLVLIWNHRSGGQTVNITDFQLNVYNNLQYKDVQVKLHDDGAENASITGNVSLPIADNYPVKSFLQQNRLIVYEDKAVTVTDATTTLDVNYTGLFPFAGSYDELTENGKWVSMFTQNGRMHVYDPLCSNGTKYPTIDRATFANLSNRKFWGFICNPFESENVKIVNKGAGRDKYLYLTSETPVHDGADIPLLMGDEQNTENYATCEWIVEPGNYTGGAQYFTIKAAKQADGNNQYINNYAGAGFMTTWRNGSGDTGSNIKFTSEQDTYDLLKERALTAPYNAVHSLTQEARALITGSTVEEYQQEITAIQEMENDGVIPFVDGAYYYLRNYTPANESNTYVLNANETGTEASMVLVPNDKVGTIEEGMKYFDLNALWKISQADPNDHGYDGGSEDIGVSKTIGRYVIHANSGNTLTNASTHKLAATPGNNDIYYFVNLGAGQHFMKNVQYSGTGNQAKAMPLSGLAGGTLTQKTPANGHFKNTRDTWYGIPVTNFEFELHKGVEGDESFYATAHLPFAISIDETEGVKAYTVGTVDKENGVLNLKEIKGTIPANTAMVLIGGKNKVTVNIIANATETAEANDYLQGVNMARAYDDEITKNNVLVLGTGATGTKVGFYLPADASTGLRSNSAYIPVSALDGVSAANGLKFNFGGVANGIDGVNADSDKSDVIYDLQGRRVNKFSKGLYIVNGKKVIL